MDGFSLCRIVTALTAGAAMLTPAAALAQTAIEDGLIFNVRLRYEGVDQDGLPETASALTMRTRAGFETPRRQGFAVLVEGEHIVHIIDDFADTVTPRPGYPVVADPEAAEINRAQISYRAENGAGATLGRQWLAFDDQRFVGPVAYRQNSQSMDAIRLNGSTDWPVTFDYAYVDRVHRIFGDDHPLGEFDSDSHVGEVRTSTPLGDVALYGLLLDFDNAPGLSSRTWGVRLTGTREAVSYRLEYAGQSDYGANLAAFDVAYGRVEVDYAGSRFSVGGGIEILGGDGSSAFQTPLATLHKFQGAADVFLVTPPDGLRDLHLRGQLRWPDAAPGPVALGIALHDFASDDGNLDLGSEVDIMASIQLTAHLTAEAKAAFFDGGSAGPADRNKLAVALVYNY